VKFPLVCGKSRKIIKIYYKKYSVYIDRYKSDIKKVALQVNKVKILQENNRVFFLQFMQVV
jgi:hypothetical protein